MFSFLRSRLPAITTSPLTTDIHSHLLAGLDDGVQSVEDALSIISVFQDLGYRKLITTPHIHQDYYRNSAATIQPALEALNIYLSQQKMKFEIQAAAEYYLDEELVRKVADREELLTFGDHYVLFETNMITEPYNLKEFIFKLTTAGYKPILAHPERYAYMTLDKAEDLRDRGILFQLNILSVIGYYSKPIQDMARKLVNQGWIDLLGSDCHQLDHARLIEYAWKNKTFLKALDLPLLNNTL